MKTTLKGGPLRLPPMIICAGPARPLLTQVPPPAPSELDADPNPYLSFTLRPRRPCYAYSPCQGCRRTTDRVNLDGKPQCGACATAIPVLRDEGVTGARKVHHAQPTTKIRHGVALVLALRLLACADAPHIKSRTLAATGQPGLYNVAMVVDGPHLHHANELLQGAAEGDAERLGCRTWQAQVEHAREDTRSKPGKPGEEAAQETATTIGGWLLCQREVPYAR